jgi:hypothetical protein
MNERIRLLAEQAEKYASEKDGKYDGAGNLNWQWQDIKMEKFAELIVREYADIALTEAQSTGNFDTFNKIVKHFGVSV